MTDRELLELAAKAAGLNIDKSPYNGGGIGNDGFDILGNAVLDWHNGKTWNPLTSDADALRLAVKLGIGVRAAYFHFPPQAQALIVWLGRGDHLIREPMLDDPAAATRRAIVRAAAEIGRQS